MAYKFAVTVGLVLFLGCASQETKFSHLTMPERQRFVRCMNAVQPCGKRKGFASDVCVGEKQESFASLEAERDRKVWLVEQGCPPSMVEPEKFVSAE